MKHLLLISGYLVLAVSVFGQRENIWMFGITGVGIDFNTPIPTTIPSSLQGYGEAAASVTNTNGDLLFYTEGNSVWDRNNNLMPNGSNLVPVPSTIAYSSTSSTSQGTVICPMPGTSDKYYIFSLLSIEQGSSFGRLYYSVIDMSLNNGLGDVVTTMKGLLLDSLFTEHMTAVGGNSCNIWLVVNYRDSPGIYCSDNFKSFEITASGINPIPVTSTFNSIVDGIHGMVGTMSFSKDRTKLARSRARPNGNGGDLAFYNFDPTTGSLSNRSVLDTSQPFYGACFSPDGSKLYASTHFSPSSSLSNEIIQYDLSFNTTSDIIASKSSIGACNGGQLKIAIDGKIYFFMESTGSSSASSSLGAIFFPNLSGVLSQYTPNYISFLPGSMGYLGLPNVVPYLFPKDTLTLPTQVEVHTPACFTDSYILKINDTLAINVIWDNGTSAMERQVDSSGKYWVSYQYPDNSCLIYIDTFIVKFPATSLPKINIQSSCFNASNGSAYAYPHPNDTISYRYIWQNLTGDTISTTDTLSDVSSGSYTLRVQTTECDTLLNVFIPEEAGRVSFQTSDTLICLGDTVQFENTSADHYAAFHWDFDDGDTVDLFAPVHRYTENGTYKVRLVGEGATCNDTAYQTIIVDQPAEPLFDIDPKEVCLGEPVYFMPNTDSTTIQHQWTLDGRTRTEKGLESRYQHAFNLAGTFSVKLTLQSRACPDTSFTDSITVYPLPEVDLGGDSSICLHGAPVYLKNLREAPLNPPHYLWSTGDTTPILKAVHPGTYTLSVTTEPIGCTTTESIEITKNCYIDIPNAFTPNGDGNNDYFFPRQLLTASINRFRMQVFNRWGQLLFESGNLDGRGWDGRFNGKDQPMGVYLYRIEVGFTNRREELYEGNVTLVR